jgi:hypothetical protein
LKREKGIKGVPSGRVLGNGQSFPEGVSQTSVWKLQRGFPMTISSRRPKILIDRYKSHKINDMYMYMWPDRLHARNVRDFYVRARPGQSLHLKSEEIVVSAVIIAYLVSMIGARQKFVLLVAGSSTVTWQSY